MHPLENEFALSAQEILDIVSRAPRLKQAVKGWIAEEHLARYFSSLNLTFNRIERDGEPDFEIITPNGRVRVECKNVMSGSNLYANGDFKVDFQKTRNSMNKPQSRFYKPDEFEILAACLHNQTGRWEFLFIRTRDLPRDKEYYDCLKKQVRVPNIHNTTNIEPWQREIMDLL
ncbi:MAG: hypothetical protein CW346_13905 [Bacillaceae bacterium]|nr:hypothetical protein [Bacillaceae bacterium]